VRFHEIFGSLPLTLKNFSTVKRAIEERYSVTQAVVRKLGEDINLSDRSCSSFASEINCKYQHYMDIICEADGHLASAS
jgi:hypothetical protein